MAAKRATKHEAIGAMPTPAPAKWEFKARFRRHAFGWKSQPAITRIKEAVREIKKVAKGDPLHAAEGTILFLERVSPAIEQVDSSSGSIGSAVNGAIEALVSVLVNAPADASVRAAWLERLYAAYEEDQIPYLESLGDFWGELCTSKELASIWADRLAPSVRASWSPDSERGYFKGTVCCLSALVAAERYDDVLELLALAPYNMWHNRQYGVRALVAKGAKAEAIRFAEEGRGLNDSPVHIARACEAILLSSGLADEAYQRYGLVANGAGTYLATFRAVSKTYPHKTASEILADLAKTTPGDEGKWFAAAKDAGLYELALSLASRSPCDPRTLTRASRDHTDAHPAFAGGAGLIALHWLAHGYGYDVTSDDVWDAYRCMMHAADRQGRAPEMKDRVRQLVSSVFEGKGFVAKILAAELQRP